MIAQRYWWLGAVVFVGCTGGPESTSLTVTEVDSAGVAIVTITGEVADLPEWHLAESPQFTVDGSEPPFLARVGQVALLSDGRVVVSDAQADQIHLFGLEGEHIRLLGDQGDGPGEYQSVTKITVGAGDSLFVYDQRHGRLSVVHPEAGFVRAVSFRTAAGVRAPRRVLSVGANRLAVHGETIAPHGDDQTFPHRRRTLAHISLAGGEGHKATESIAIQGRVTAVSEAREALAAFSNIPVLEAADGKLVYGSGVRYELSVRNSAFEHLREIRWVGWDRRIGEEDVEAVRIGIRQTYRELGAPEFAAVMEELLLTATMLTEEQPAFNRVLMDDMGRIWVSEFRSRFLEASLEWHILDASGHPIGRIALPFGSRLMAVRGSQVALLVSDELDVPSVEVRDLLN